MQLKDIRVGEHFNLVCKILHLAEVQKEDWVYAWDGTDTPANPIETRSVFPCYLFDELLLSGFRSILAFQMLLLIGIAIALFFSAVFSFWVSIQIFWVN